MLWDMQLPLGTKQPFPAQDDWEDLPHQLLNNRIDSGLTTLTSNRLKL